MRAPRLHACIRVRVCVRVRVVVLCVRVFAWGSLAGASLPLARGCLPLCWKPVMMTRFFGGSAPVRVQQRLDAVVGKLSSRCCGLRDSARDELVHQLFPDRPQLRFRHFVLAGRTSE